MARHHAGESSGARGAGWERYAVALVIMAGVCGLRAVLDPFLGDDLPFVTLFAGVALSALLCRWRPATVAAAVGFIAMNYWFVEPRWGFAMNTPILAGTVGYGISAVLIIVMGELLHRSRERLEEKFKEGRARERDLELQGQILQEREASLREAKDAAESASRAKDEFISRLSHELRTPLTPVLMTASALQDDPSLPQDARSAFEMIARNIAIEARLVDDLLDVTRIIRGKVTLRPEPCEIHEIIELAGGMIQAASVEKQMEIVLERGTRDSQLVGDRTRLQQVFWNLLSNAVKFGRAGGQVHVATRNAPSGEIVVEVSDDGRGFEPTEAEVLFEPFHQAPSSANGGLGLGLPIARAIVHLHGGRIDASSKGIGHGATFRVELPRA